MVVVIVEISNGNKDDMVRLIISIFSVNISLVIGVLKIFLMVFVVL